MCVCGGLADSVLHHHDGNTERPYASHDHLRCQAHTKHTHGHIQTCKGYVYSRTRTISSASQAGLSFAPTPALRSRIHRPKHKNGGPQIFASVALCALSTRVLEYHAHVSCTRNLYNHKSQSSTNGTRVLEYPDMLPFKRARTCGKLK